MANKPNMRNVSLPTDVEEDLKRKLVVRGCRQCGKSFEFERIQFYEHSDGWNIQVNDGMFDYSNLKLWLYIECPKCHTQWSLWKLGVGRDEAETKNMLERCLIWQKMFQQLEFQNSVNEKLKGYEDALRLRSSHDLFVEYHGIVKSLNANHSNETYELNLKAKKYETILAERGLL